MVMIGDLEAGEDLVQVLIVATLPLRRFALLALPGNVDGSSGPGGPRFDKGAFRSPRPNCLRRGSSSASDQVHQKRNGSIC